MLTTEGDSTRDLTSSVGHLPCVRCGYDLFGAIANNCPECLHPLCDSTNKKRLYSRPFSLLTNCRTAQMSWLLAVCLGTVLAGFGPVLGPLPKGRVILHGLVVLLIVVGAVYMSLVGMRFGTTSASYLAVALLVSAVCESAYLLWVIYRGFSLPQGLVLQLTAQVRSGVRVLQCLAFYEVLAMIMTILPNRRWAFVCHLTAGICALSGALLFAINTWGNPTYGWQSTMLRGLLFLRVPMALVCLSLGLYSIQAVILQKIRFRIYNEVGAS